MNLSFKGIKEEQGRIELFDLTGKEVWRKTIFFIESEAKELDLNGLSAGIYTLRLTNGTALKTAKVMVE